jgi:hypothetical protein
LSRTRRPRNSIKQPMPLATTNVLAAGTSLAPEPAPDAARTESISACLRSTICRSVRQVCVDAIGSGLKAIVLTGSLARDEATLARRQDSFSILGDAEFLLVLQKRENLPRAADICALRQRIERDLLQRQVSCKVDLSAVRPDYFRRLPPHIFTYELKHCGRVIWGDSDILQAIPEFSAADLSREDAARLLANRLVELLECAPEIFSDKAPSSPMFRYRLLKLYLDMATSLLVFLRSYAPTYRERQQILSRLANHRARFTDPPFDRGALAKCVVACTHWKLASHEVLEDFPNLCWRDALRSAHALWRWELTQLTGAPHSSTDEELFRVWNRMQARRANLRGWARVLRSCGWRRSCRQWPGWSTHCWGTGPRFNVYQAAFGLLFGALSIPSQTTSAFESSVLRHLLPIDPDAQDVSGPDDRLALAAAIVANYQEFLVGTRL